MTIQTVADLIEALRTFPQDAYVVVHDGGHDGDTTSPTPEIVTGHMSPGWPKGTQSFTPAYGAEPGPVIGVRL